jgi:hypothetical protein
MMCKIMGIFSDVGRYGYKSLSVGIRFAISMMEASYLCFAKYKASLSDHDRYSHAGFISLSVRARYISIP